MPLMPLNLVQTTTKRILCLWRSSSLTLPVFVHAQKKPGENHSEGLWSQDNCASFMKLLSRFLPLYAEEHNTAMLPCFLSDIFRLFVLFSHMSSEFRWFDCDEENMEGSRETDCRMDTCDCLELEETIKGPVALLLQHATQGLW